MSLWIGFVVSSAASCKSLENSVIHYRKNPCFELSREREKAGGWGGRVWRHYGLWREQGSGCVSGGDKRQVRGWDTAYQMTGLPTAGDDLSKKPLISGQALGRHSPLIRACCCQWLTPTPVHSGCRAEDDNSRQAYTSTDCCQASVIYGCSAELA